MLDVVIVGAGLAGLTCARALHAEGRSVKVFEAADAVGGRVRTDEIEGFRLDRGFQVLLTGYPEAQRWLDYAKLDLKPFRPGALVHHDGRFSRVADPLREPLAAVASLSAPVGSLADKLRILKLRRAVTKPSAEALWDRDEITTDEALRSRYGFSKTIIERFFRPFFGGVLLDRNLGASSRAFEYYFRHFATSKTAVPAEGMQRIPEQLAAGLPPRTVQLNSRVRSATADSVTLDTGERVEARAVVLAVEGPELNYLVPGFEAVGSQSTVCLYYDVPETPHVEPYLVLDAEGRGPAHHLAVMSTVSSAYAPKGRHLVSVSVVGMPGQADDELDQRVRAQMGTWYGETVTGWRLLRVYRIPHALPDQSPPALSPPERPARLATGLYVAGDHRTNASINGAMVSGRRAAEAVLADLPA